jgi:hypothetical protein
VSQVLTLMASLMAKQPGSDSLQGLAAHDLPPIPISMETSADIADTSDEEPIAIRLKGAQSKALKLPEKKPFEGEAVSVLTAVKNEVMNGVKKEPRKRVKKRLKRELSHVSSDTPSAVLQTRVSDASETASDSGRPKRKKDALKETLAKFSMPERISISDAAANGQPAAPIFAGLTGRNAGLKLNPHGRGIRVSPMLMPRVVAERASPFAPLSGPLTAELTASGSIHIDGPPVGQPSRSPPPRLNEVVAIPEPPPPQPAAFTPPAIGIPLAAPVAVLHHPEGGARMPALRPPSSGTVYPARGAPVTPQWEDSQAPPAPSPVSGGWEYPQLGSGVYDFASQLLAPDAPLPPPIKPPKRLEVAQKKTAEPQKGGGQRKIRPRGGPKLGAVEEASEGEVADTVMRLAATFKQAEDGANGGGIPPAVAALFGPENLHIAKSLMGWESKRAEGGRKPLWVNGKPLERAVASDRMRSAKRENQWGGGSGAEREGAQTGAGVVGGYEYGNGGPRGGSDGRGAERTGRTAHLLAGRRSENKAFSGFLALIQCFLVQ